MRCVKVCTDVIGRRALADANNVLDTGNFQRGPSILASVPLTTLVIAEDISNARARQQLLPHAASRARLGSEGYFSENRPGNRVQCDGVFT